MPIVRTGQLVSSGTINAAGIIDRESGARTVHEAGVIARATTRLERAAEGSRQTTPSCSQMIRNTIDVGQVRAPRRRCDARLFALRR